MINKNCITWIDLGSRQTLWYCNVVDTWDVEKLYVNRVNYGIKVKKYYYGDRLVD